MQNSKKHSLFDMCLVHTRADRALRMFVSNALESYNVTFMEWLMLSITCQGPSTGVGMTAVAQELDVTLPQVTSLANKLLEHGLIEQEIQAHDRRARNVVPTAKGRRVWQTVERQITPEVNDWLVEAIGLGAQEVADYTKTAQKIGLTSSQLKTQ